jgi:hypothetical protein
MKNPYLEGALHDVTVNLPGITFRANHEEGWLQVQDLTLPSEIQGGRKWRISEHMTKSEIVQTMLAATLAWFEHEVREAFMYRGENIFSPHYDVDQLLELRTSAQPFDVRGRAA